VEHVLFTNQYVFLVTIKSTVTINANNDWCIAASAFFY